MDDKKNLLYIDRPFLGLLGGDKNRSRFIWGTLSHNFHVDNVWIIFENELQQKSLEFPIQDSEHYILRTQRPSFLSPQAIYNFNKEQYEVFKGVLLSKKYDFIFCRFIAPAYLLEFAKSILPDVTVICDVDMLPSKLAKRIWMSNRTVKNRYFFFEKWKLYFFERNFFSKEYLFFFSNLNELKQIKNEQQAIGKGSYELLPNIFPDPSHVNISGHKEKESYILFFGALGSSVNKDAFKYICEEIYPLIEHSLRKHNTKLWIVGKEMTSFYHDFAKKYSMPYLSLVGEKENIEEVIDYSQFVLLPLRILAGTCTRILEVASLKKAVITTSVGVDGLSLTSDEVVVEEDPVSISKKVDYYLAHPDEARKRGEKLYEKCKKLFDESAVGRILIDKINEYRAQKQ